MSGSDLKFAAEEVAGERRVLLTHVVLYPAVDRKVKTDKSGYRVWPICSYNRIQMSSTYSLEGPLALNRLVYQT